MVRHIHISKNEDNQYFVSAHTNSITHNTSSFTLSNQSNTIKSFHHRSRKHKHHHGSKRHKRSHTVCHITIRPPLNTIHPTDNKIITSHRSVSHSKKSRIIRNKKKKPISSTRSTSSIQSPPHHYSSLRKFDYQSEYVRPSRGTDREIILQKNHYPITKKRQKKIWLRRCIIVSLVTTLIISILLAIILPTVLLLKAKTGTTFNRTAVLRWNTTGITLVGLSGIAGNTSYQLNSPRDVLFVYPNILYIADTGNNRIQKHIIGEANSTTVAGQTNGTGGSSASHLNSPSCVRIDSNSGVYVADTMNSRIQYWSDGASSGVTVAGNGTNGLFNATNSISTIYGIDYDINTGILYVPDYGTARILAYAFGASSGTVIAGGNGIGRNNTQLYNPIRVYFDSWSNSVVVSNHAAHNIVRWPLGATHWTVLAGDPNGNLGNTSTELRFPLDAIFDPMGNMYVVDKDNYRIQLFMAGQSEGITIAGATRVYGNTSTLLAQPWSVKLDNQLNLYVADTRNHRIQKFVRY